MLFTLLFISFSSFFQFFPLFSQIKKKTLKILLHNMFPIFVLRTTHTAHTHIVSKRRQKKPEEKTRFISFYSRSVTNTRCLDFGGYILTHHCDPAAVAAVSAAAACGVVALVHSFDYIAHWCVTVLPCSHSASAIIVMLVALNSMRAIHRGPYENTINLAKCIRFIFFYFPV